MQKNTKGTTIKLVGEYAFQSLSTKEFTLSPSNRRKKEPSRKPFQIAFLVNKKSSNLGLLRRRTGTAVDSPVPSQAAQRF